MTLRQSGCLAAAVSVLAAWGVIIALTWESTVTAVVCGVVFLVGVGLLVRHAAAVRREAGREQRERELGLEGANKPGAPGVKNPDSGTGGSS